jgi:hypothetical protein
MRVHENVIKFVGISGVGCVVLSLMIKQLDRALHRPYQWGEITAVLGLIGMLLLVLGLILVYARR